MAVAMISGSKCHKWVMRTWASVPSGEQSKLSSTSTPWRHSKLQRRDKEAVIGANIIQKNEEKDSLKFEYMCICRVFTTSCMSVLGSYNAFIGQMCKSVLQLQHVMSFSSKTLHWLKNRY